jgi:diacylglycerol kinase family enzyme
MNGPFCLVVNPAAGRGRSLRAVPAATASLDAAAATYHVSESASLDHAREIATRAAGLGHVVVAVGGDGTAGALAGVAAGAGARYGIIPAGNGNDFARALGIPFDAAAAAQALTTGRERQVDLIAVSAAGQPEIIVAGSVYAGLPSVAGEIANQARWLRGPLVYPAAALRALASWSPAAFRVDVIGGDGPAPAEQTPVQQTPVQASVQQASVREFAGYAVVVANSAYFGAGMKVAPSAEIDDGLLEVLIMRHGPRLAFIRVLMKIRNGTHLGLPLISHDRAREVTVTVDRHLPAAADGDTLPCAAPLPAGTPLRIRALPGALRVLGPA